MEANDGKDAIDSGEELMQMFQQIKKAFKQEMEEKEFLKQKLEYIENNEEWGKKHVNQLRQFSNEKNKCFETLQNSLDEFKPLKDINNGLNEEIMDLKTSLTQKEKVNQDLNLMISSKDILLNQTKRELMDNKNKNEENITEIKEFYENKIKELNKQFDDNYQKIHKQNDERIIEIRANCMRSVDKTKEEYETQILQKDTEIKELKEKNSDLNLEFQAMKMSDKFVNPKNISKNQRSAQKSKSGTQSTSHTKQTLNIQILDSDSDSSDLLNQSIHKSESKPVPKRKKLGQKSDYSDYILDN